MKLKNKTLALLLALGAAATLSVPGAQAASAVNGDILVGFRATGGTGSTKNLVINLGAATALESATGAVNLGNINADLTATYGSDWATRANLFWGAAGTTGSFTDIGTNPAKTVYGSRAGYEAWLRANSASQAAVTNKVVALMTAFNGASTAGVTHANAVVQTASTTNSWSSYQSGGTVANSGPLPGISFAFFNPTIEGAFGSDTAMVHLYRVKPAAGAEISTAADYLGALVLESSGNLLFEPATSVSRLSIATPIVTVLQGTTTATVVVRRIPGTGTGANATTVAIATADGVTSTMPPFTGGKVGTDFTALSSTVNFAANEIFKSVEVTLKPQLAAVTNRIFTVNLSSPAANAALESAASASVRIISDTAASPTIKITSPVGIASSTVWPVVTAGIAGSPIGVDRVEVSLNNGPVVVATLGTATSAAAVPWSASFEPIHGLNRLVATVYDFAGNSATVRRSFNFVRRYNVSLTRSVPEGISTTPDTAGLVTMLATPTTSATAPSPSTVNTVTRTSQVIPGTTVKFTAAAKVGYSFSNWSGLPVGATVAGDVVSFTMPSSNVAITATYTANVFGGASSQTVGSFAGLIRPSEGTISNNVTEGFVSGTLTAASGLFAGKLLIDGQSIDCGGTFYGNGEFFFTAGTTKVPTKTLSSGRTFDMTIAGDVITATLTDATLGNSTGTIKRALYSTASKVPAALLNSATKGLYTLGFPSKAQTPELALDLFPQGDGFGSITLSDVGVVGLAGTLADGTAITVSSILVAGNECPIFVQLATPGSTTVKGGSFGGVLTFDATQTDSDVSGVNFRWFRPAVTAPLTANAVMDLYTAGWPEGIKVDAVGALYDATKTIEQSLGTTQNASANIDLLFDNVRYRVSTTGGSTYNYGTKQIAVSTIKVVNSVFTVPTTAAATLTAVQTTGAFSGTVKVDVTAPTSTPAYKGIIVQKGANQGGYGYVISNTAGDRDQESGGVSLTAK